MYNYPVELIPDDNDTVMVVFPDVPGAVTFGDDEGDALGRARDALETALAGYISDRRDIPAASSPAGRPFVTPSMLAVLKLVVYQAMRDRGWRKADLGRELGRSPTQIDRLLDLRHSSSVDQIEAALVACGRAPTKDVGAAAVPLLLNFAGRGAHCDWAVRAGSDRRKFTIHLPHQEHKAFNMMTRCSRLVRDWVAHHKREVAVDPRFAEWVFLVNDGQSVWTRCLVEAARDGGAATRVDESQTSG